MYVDALLFPSKAPKEEALRHKAQQHYTLHEIVQLDLLEEFQGIPRDPPLPQVRTPEGFKPGLQVCLDPRAMHTNTQTGIDPPLVSLKTETG